MHSIVLLVVLILTLNLAITAQDLPGEIQRSPGYIKPDLTPTVDNNSTGEHALDEVRKGNSHFKRKDYAGAVESYERALKLNRDFHAAYYNLGVANFDWGRFEAASQALKRAIALKPDAGTHELLGVVYQRLKDPQSAIANYKKALELNPESIVANNNLGYSYLDLRRYELAAFYFRNVLSLNPEFAESTEGLCIALASLPPTLEALEVCTNAASLPNDSPVYQYLLGYIYFSLDHFREAIDGFTKSLSTSPMGALSHNGLGHSYFRLGQHKEALHHFQKAIEINPNLSDAYAGLGSVYYRLRKPKEAAKALRQALVHNPDSAETKYNLAIACLTLNQRECALEQYNSLKHDEPEVSSRLYRLLFRNRVIDARDQTKR